MFIFFNNLSKCRLAHNIMSFNEKYVSCMISKSVVVYNESRSIPSITLPRLLNPSVLFTVLPSDSANLQKPVIKDSLVV